MSTIQYFYSVRVAVATGLNGSGTVHVSNSEDEGSQTYVEGNSQYRNGAIGKQYYYEPYLFATPNSKSIFIGWSHSSDGSNLIEGSDVSPYQLRFGYKGSSYNSSAPENHTYYAVFYSPTVVSYSASESSFTLVGHEQTHDVVVSFDVREATSLSDFVVRLSGDSRFSLVGEPVWTSKPSNGVGGYVVTYTVRYRSDERHGTSEGTLRLMSVRGNSSLSCTITAVNPNLTIESASSPEIYTTYRPDVHRQEDVHGRAVFGVANMDDISDLATPTLTDMSEGSVWSIGGMTYESGQVTIDYTYNGGMSAGTHLAVLTLAATADAGGASKSLTLVAHNSEESPDDAKVVSAAGKLIYQGAWSTALSKANTNEHCTLTLLRNVEVSKSQSISKSMTIDFAGNTLSGSVNGKMLNIKEPTTHVVLTDSKSGGGVSNITNWNGRSYAIYITQGEVTIEGGVYHVENNAVYHSTDQASVGASGIAQAAGTVMTMNGGAVEALGGRAVYGLYANSSVADNTFTTLNGGTVYAEAPYTAYGVVGYDRITINGGIVTAKVNTGIVDSKYAEGSSTNLGNANARGIAVLASAKEDFSTSYSGTLLMTGGTVNVVGERQRNYALKNYGVYIGYSFYALTEGHANDGSKIHKIAARGEITGGKIQVQAESYNAIGVLCSGSYDRNGEPSVNLTMRNCTVDVSCRSYAYGVMADAVVNSTHGGCTAGSIELTDVTVNATTTLYGYARALFVGATSGTVFADNSELYQGEYAVAGKMIVNSGQYKSQSKTSYSETAATEVRAKSMFSPRNSDVSQRILGGQAEAYPQLIIHNGSFKAISGTSYARALSSGGNTIVDGGTFEAIATTYYGIGLYAQAGTLTATSATVQAQANGVVSAGTNDNAYAYGVMIDAVVPMSTEIPTGFEHAARGELNDLTVSAKSTVGLIARGVSVATVAKQYTADQLQADSLKNKWSASNYKAYKSIYPLNQWRVAAGSCVINGGSYAAHSTTSNACGVFLASTSISDDGKTATGSLELNNVRIEATADQTMAYGIRAGGEAKINNCAVQVRAGTSSAYGLLTANQTSELTNSTLTVESAQSAYGIYAQGTVGKKGIPLVGSLQLSGNNQVSATATTMGKANAIYLGGVTSTVDGSDYAYATSATIDGGTYTASAPESSYALSIAKKQTLNAAMAQVQCSVNGGSFRGSTADINALGTVGSVVLNGGYFTHLTNLSTYVAPEKLVFDLPTSDSQYAEGYRHIISDQSQGGEVCRIYEGTTVRGSFNSLEEALQYVNANIGKYLTIVMLTHYTLPAGEYVLPERARLLVPCKDDEGRGGRSLMETNLVYNYNNGQLITPYMYRKLVLARGAHLTVQGYIEVSAAQYPAVGGKAITGCVQGPYGQIYMEEDSRMDLEATAKLYAWGYVSGKGLINAKRNASIYEDFQMGYWRGGSATYAMRNNEYKAFFVTDYFFQNIECPIRYRAGSNSVGYSSVYAAGGIRTISDVRLVGTETAMFTMDPSDERDDTWIMRAYDPTTDRVNWTLNSGAKIENMRIVMSNMPFIGTVDMNSMDYNLPITSNFTISLNYGRMEMSNDMLFMPGSQLIINKEATAVVAEGKKIYFYDSSDWAMTGSKYYWPATYSPSWGSANPRVEAYPPTEPLPSVEVFVHGSIEVNGALFTTGDRVGSANIHSTNTDAGSIVYNADATEDGTLGQCVSITPDYVSTTVGSAQLLNGDGTYTQTKNTKSGYTFVYINNRWTRHLVEGCFTATLDRSGKHYYARPSDVVEVAANTSDNAYHAVGNPSRTFIFTEKATTELNCQWWEAEYKGLIDGKICYMANNPNFDNFGYYYYYDDEQGFWVEKYVTVTWENFDGSTLYYSDGSPTIDPVPYNSSPIYYGQNPVRPNTSVYQYAWTGWTIKGDDSGTVYDKFQDMPRVTQNTTFVAYIDEQRWQFTVSFKRKDGTTIEDQLLPTGAVPVCSFNPPTMPPTVDQVFTFSNWEGYEPNQSLPPVSRPVTYYALFNSAPRSYQIVFYDADAHTMLSNTYIQYGTPAYYPSTQPYKESNSAYSFDFSGWKNSDGVIYAVGAPLPEVKGETYYVAQYVQVPKRYRITFVADNGEPDESANWQYGQLPSYSLGEPVKSSDAEWNYTFDHWSPEIEEVSEDAVYTAVYMQTKRKYTVRFVNYDGTDLIEPQLLDYGEMPTVPPNPVRPNGTSYSYLFDHWSPDIEAVSTDVVYQAVYKQTELNFGPLMDIVDWSDNALILNMNGFAGTGSATEMTAWTVKVKGVEQTVRYSDLDEHGLCKIDVSTLEREPDDDIIIMAYNHDGSLASYHKYVVPYIINADAKVSDVLADASESCVVLVRSDELIVDQDLTVGQIYVYPSAHLTVADNVALEVERLVMRTQPHVLPPLLTDNGQLAATQFFYSYISTDNSQAYEFALPYNADLYEVITSSDCLNQRLSAAGVTPYRSLFSMLYYNAQQRADLGAGAGNWNNLATEHIMQEMRGYQLIAASDHYYEFYFPIDYTAKYDPREVEIKAYMGASEAESDYGWNYVTVPSTDIYWIDTADISPEERIKVTALVYNPATEQESFRQYVPDYLEPTQPFYYQSRGDGKLVFNDGRCVFVDGSTPSRLPIEKMPNHSASGETQWINLLATDTLGHSDQLSVYLNSDKFTATYQRGYDLAKFWSADVAFYASLDYGDMAFAALPDSMAQMGVPLTIESNHATEWNISLLKNRYLDRLERLLLIDYHAGSEIDLLSSDYLFSANQGVVSGRFVLLPIFKKADLPTDLSLSQSSVTIVGNSIHVSLPSQGIIACYDMTGKLISEGKFAEGNLTVPAAGLYLLRINSQARLVAVQ